MSTRIVTFIYRYWFNLSSRFYVNKPQCSFRKKYNFFQPFEFPLRKVFGVVVLVFLQLPPLNGSHKN